MADTAVALPDDEIDTLAGVDSPEAHGETDLEVVEQPGPAGPSPLNFATTTAPLWLLRQPFESSLRLPSFSLTFHIRMAGILLAGTAAMVTSQQGEEDDETESTKSSDANEVD